MESSYKNIEVILVDNNSDFDITEVIPKKMLSKIKFVRSDVNLGAAGGRNLGVRHSTGDYLLFYDDDVVADKKMIEELVKGISLNKNYAVVSPKIYDMHKRDTLQAVGHWVNMKTGRIGGWGVYEKDKGQFNKMLKVPMAGGILLVRKKIFKELGGFDEIFFIPYEDSDFTYRATRRGYDVMFIPTALCYHPSKKNTMPKQIQALGISSPERAYRTLRNKIILVRKNGMPYEIFIFVCFFVPIYFTIHTVIILSAHEFKTLMYYWKGTLSGLLYVAGGSRFARLI